MKEKFKMKKWQKATVIILALITILACTYAICGANLIERFRNNPKPIVQAPIYIEPIVQTPIYTEQNTTDIEEPVILIKNITDFNKNLKNVYAFKLVYNNSSSIDTKYTLYALTENKKDILIYKFSEEKYYDLRLIGCENGKIYLSNTSGSFYETTDKPVTWLCYIDLNKNNYKVEKAFKYYFNPIESPINIIYKGYLYYSSIYYVNEKTDSKDSIYRAKLSTGKKQKVIEKIIPKKYAISPAIGKFAIQNDKIYYYSYPYFLNDDAWEDIKDEIKYSCELNQVDLDGKNMVNIARGYTIPEDDIISAIGKNEVLYQLQDNINSTSYTKIYNTETGKTEVLTNFGKIIQIVGNSIIGNYIDKDSYKDDYSFTDRIIIKNGEQEKIIPLFVNNVMNRLSEISLTSDYKLKATLLDSNYILTIDTSTLKYNFTEETEKNINKIKENKDTSEYVYLYDNFSKSLENRDKMGP